MTENKNQTEELKKLVQISTFFDDGEKKQIFKQIPQINGDEIKKAIEILKEEQEKLERLKKTGDHNLNLMKQFADESQKEIETMARDVAHKIETREEEKEAEEAEQILKSIE